MLFSVIFGRGLGTVLKGEVEPLSLMIEDNRLNRMYENQESLQRGYEAIRQYFDVYGDENPNMQALEIGAGTGGVTQSILRTLKDGARAFSRLQRYVYTDISPGFFEQAKQKFSSFADCLEYAVLDIEQELEQQGYELYQKDVIVASNVLHATIDIKKTMERVRRLLKTGGRLVPLEYTEPGLSHFPFGTTEGWWGYVCMTHCPFMYFSSFTS